MVRQINHCDPCSNGNLLPTLTHMRFRLQLMPVLARLWRKRPVCPVRRSRREAIWPKGQNISGECAATTIAATVHGRARLHSRRKTPVWPGSQSIRQPPPNLTCRHDCDAHFVVTNDGTETDNFTLAISGSDWETSAPGTTGDLNSGASVSIDVTVTIPPLTRHWKAIRLFWTAIYLY